MGEWALKIGKSFASYIFIKSFAGLGAAISELGAAWAIGGTAANIWTELVEKIQAANGGMNVVAIGTRTALAHCTLGGNFQVEIGEEMNKVGFLDQYQGVPLIAISNVLNPQYINSNPTLILPNDKIYLVPVAGEKPVKILFEGDQIAVNYDPEHTSDVRYGISVEMRVGIGSVIGPKFGVVNL